jgi:hypothetical protein
MITPDYEKIKNVYLSQLFLYEIEHHCLRKLTGNFFDDETPENQAYGLLGARLENDSIYIEKIFPCKLNFRCDPSVLNHMNDLVKTYAISADTPINQRGWVMQPEELLNAYDTFAELGLTLIGSYHMHHDGSWLGTIPKEYPSEFDAKLAENSEMLMFIASVKSNSLYSLKAFYNGLKEKEIRIITSDE